MALSPTFKQDPTARLDYAIDWAGPKPGPYLEKGDSIASASARVEGTAPTGFVVEDPVDLLGNTTVVWVATTDVAPGKYGVVVSIETSAGRKDERSITIQVADQ